MRNWLLPLLVLQLGMVSAGWCGETRKSAEYQRIKLKLNAVAAIDTHDHLPPFPQLPGITETERGRGVNLHGLLQNSYYTWYNPLTPWQPRMKFADWWETARHDFRDARATSFYRYLLPAFQDLYGVDFDTLTAEQAADLDRRIFENYRDETWLRRVITERANIELMFEDPYWNRLGFKTYYPFEVLVFNVTFLVRGFHESEFSGGGLTVRDNPYEFARQQGLTVDSFEEYLKLLEALFLAARDKGAVCLKSTIAYNRTLQFDKVSAERAQRAFGKRRSALSAAEIKDFEDYIFWRLCSLSGKYELPFQIHTGQARIQGSNPLLLVDLIEAHPQTKFILFHGGYPWIGETAVILQRHSKHVWLDSVWLPMLSYSTAKRAFHEWLDAFPSNRIMWGADCRDAEGIYGATETTRRCLAEVLAEKVQAGDLREEHALRIGRQILRDNALELFPSLKERLWKHRGPLPPAPPLPEKGRSVP